jgi:hypothetical protein
MKILKILYKLFLVLTMVAFVSCKDQLTELNVDPTGVDPETVQPNLMITTVITQFSTDYLKGGYDGWSAGVMQYVQKSGWGSGLNKYDWNSEADWDAYYGYLSNAQHLLERSEEEELEFHQGLAKIFRALNFAYIADWWGDAPYTEALNAPDGKQEDLFPVFDSQETIYRGIIDELKEANTLLSKPVGEYDGIDPDTDVIYGGDPAKWQKLANSLMLRYYLRVSTKLEGYAIKGIEDILGDPVTYPIFTSSDDDATMGYIGTFEGDAWPNAIAFDANESNFNRVQLCAGLRDVLLDFNDPRLAVWFNKVRTPIKVSTAFVPAGDTIVDGVRYLHPDTMVVKDQVVYNKGTWAADVLAGKVIIDTLDYVGIPIGVSKGDPRGYNLNPSPIQGGSNVQVSALADMYKDSKGDMLLARLMSYAEVCFILAEAAQKGMSVVEPQQTWYEKGIEASFITWKVDDDYAAYIAGAGVAYDGSLEQIMVQKWIANWTNSVEAHSDWRRTAFPVLTIAPIGRRDAMPLRVQYGGREKSRNNANYNAAILNLEQTPFTANDGNDSAWSKFWLLQGTGKPY